MPQPSIPTPEEEANASLFNVVERGNPHDVTDLLWDDKTGLHVRLEGLENAEGRTLASVAAAREDSAMLVHLHAIGGKTLLDSASLSGETAVHVAARAGRADTVRVLAEMGADLLARNAHGDTAAHVAARLGRADVMDAMPTEALTVRDAQGHKPVDIAAMHGQSEVCKLLVKRGVILDGADRQGDTPLHHAAAHGDVATIDILLKSPGVDPQDTNHGGLTPLQVASAKGNHDAVERLTSQVATPAAGAQWQQVLLAQGMPAPHDPASAAPKASAADGPTL